MSVGRKAEGDRGEDDEAEERDEGAPDGEVVDRQEGVGARAYGTDGCHCAGGAEDAEETAEDGVEVLGRGWVVLGGGHRWRVEGTVC